MKNNPLYPQAWDKIKEANNILIISHVNPDGDAIASVTVWLEILKSLNKNCTAFCDRKSANTYSFLAHESSILSEPKFDLADFDLLIILDCGSLFRTSLETEIRAQRDHLYIIEFDHHPQVDDYADLEFRYPDAAATAEVLYYFMKVNNINFNRNLANSILTGILTDTGNFLYPSTSDETINIASEMLGYGAQFPKIFQNTYQNKSIFSMKLWGLALDNLVINEKYNFAYSVLSYDDIQANKDEKEEDVFGDIVGFLSNLDGVRGVALIREEEKGKIKCSLRSSDPDMDVSKLASHLGGGGHKKAAACSIAGNLAKTERGWKII